MIEKATMLQFALVYLPANFSFQFITTGVYSQKDLLECMRIRRRELGLEYKELLDTGAIMPWETCEVHHRAVLANVVVAELLAAGPFVLNIPATDGGSLGCKISENLAAVWDRLPIFQKPICRIPTPCYN